MQDVTITLPEELVAALGVSGTDLSRAALEALALEAYRSAKFRRRNSGAYWACQFAWTWTRSSKNMGWSRSTAWKTLNATVRPIAV
jgi:hypothetical protein